MGLRLRLRVRLRLRLALMLRLGLMLRNGLLAIFFCGFGVKTILFECFVLRGVYTQILFYPSHSVIHKCVDIYNKN